METIFAQSTPYGKSGVAVYRLSGALSLNCLVKLTRKDSFTPRQLYKVNLFSSNGDKIDEAMAVYFKMPKSFTGEEVVEIYSHGSIAISKLLLNEVLSFDGVRLAEPGEFTKRAVLNNKMDLTAAEGLIDLIEAETSMQHKQAVSQMAGELDKLYDSWREKLISIMALIEAYIDFPDEEIPAETKFQAEKFITSLCSDLTNHLDDNRRGERLREGIKLCIYGEPNVGKSSLINLLTQRDIAIVSNIPGTTRDIIESNIDIGGYPFILLDTAGIRDYTSDIIEQEGIKRAYKAIDDSEITILMLSPENFKSFNFVNKKNEIIVLNKMDQLNDKELGNLPKEIIPISVNYKTNIDKLMLTVINIAEELARPEETPHITRTRHRVAVSKALASLKQFNLENDLVLAAEDVRIAIRQLGNLIGRIDVDEVLGEIFAKFCIGK